jgi:hypothetical protein
MKKLLMLVVVVLAATMCSFAQSGYNKSEVFVGFSHEEVDGSTFIFPETSNSIRNTGAQKFNGFNAAAVYNFSRYIGVKADVSGVYHGGDFNYRLDPATAITGTVHNSLYNVLGGVQFKDNASTSLLKPFAHVLVWASAMPTCG